MEKANQITIQKKELPELKKWLEKKNKKILKIIELEKDSIRVIVENMIDNLVMNKLNKESKSMQISK